MSGFFLSLQKCYLHCSEFCKFLQDNENQSWPLPLPLPSPRKTCSLYHCYSNRAWFSPDLHQIIFYISGVEKWKNLHVLKIEFVIAIWLIYELLNHAQNYPSEIMVHWPLSAVWTNSLEPVWTFAGAEGLGLFDALVLISECLLHAGRHPLTYQELDPVLSATHASLWGPQTAVPFGHFCQSAASFYFFLVSLVRVRVRFLYGSNVSTKLFTIFFLKQCSYFFFLRVKNDQKINSECHLYDYLLSYKWH